MTMMINSHIACLCAPLGALADGQTCDLSSLRLHGEVLRAVAASARFQRVEAVAIVVAHTTADDNDDPHSALSYGRRRRRWLCCLRRCQCER